MRNSDRSVQTSTALSNGALGLLVSETRRAYQVATALARKMLSYDARIGMYWDDEMSERPTLQTSSASRSGPMTTPSAVSFSRGRVLSTGRVRSGGQRRVDTGVTPIRVFRRRPDVTDAPYGSTNR